MTSTHIFFIPAVMLMGVAIGYVLGGRAVRAELEKKRARLKE
jgi:proteasome assembly chaperone (PAC2) family protein